MSTLKSATELPVAVDGNHSAKSILSRTAKGAGWTIGWRIATRAIGFCSTLILVRLLTPGDFGIVSLAIGFFQALDGVAGFSVEGAIIRTDTPDRSIYDAGFTINVVRGVFTSAMMAAFAIPVARFFGNQHLVEIIYVLAATWAVSALQNVGIIEFRRNLAFNMEFKIQIIPRLLALAVTIPAAFLWHSYWALVAGIIASRLLTVSLSYIMHPYRPRLGIAGIPRIFSFSFWEWLIGLLNLFSTRADSFIIGRIISTAAVGVYGVGAEIASLPSSEIVAPLCRALFSGFAAERREGSDGSVMLLRVLSFLALFTLPLSVGLSLVAYPLVKLGFGAEWLQAVPLVQLLALAGAIGLFSAVAEALFSAHAWLRSILWMTAVVSTLRFSLSLLLIPEYGLVGGAVSAIVAGIIQEVVFVATIMHRLKLRIGLIMASVMRPAIAAGVMAGTLTKAGLGWNDWIGTNADLGADLAIAIGLGIVIYVTCLIALWFSAGRPAGPEADAVSIVNRFTSRT
ncbi:oligosaccharide flippase family protein [Rhodopila sp.]|uniref:oligosaccharide flippase family protein n=1 Tax=Rhodopila sp. TaxID=2480087 RepID=UPI003D099266